MRNRLFTQATQEPPREKETYAMIIASFSTIFSIICSRSEDPRRAEPRLSSSAGEYPCGLCLFWFFGGVIPYSTGLYFTCLRIAAQSLRIYFIIFPTATTHSDKVHIFWLCLSLCFFIFIFMFGFPSRSSGEAVSVTVA